MIRYGENESSLVYSYHYLPKGKGKCEVIKCSTAT